jgi:hypothetical protein
VKRCVRPDHLFLGSQADNIADRDAKGHVAAGDRNGMRTHPERSGRGAARGEASARARYTAADVLLWREMYARGEWSTRKLAAHLGVDHNTLYAILSRRSWRHI